MDATPHLALSAALTMRVRNPLLAVGIGLVSHSVVDAIVLDEIPHHYVWIMLSATPIIADLAVGACLALIITAMAPRPWSALAGAAAGILPDVNRVFAPNQPDLLAQLHLQLPYLVLAFPWGVMTQIGVVVIALVIAFRLRKERLPMRSVRGETRD